MLEVNGRVPRIFKVLDSVQGEFISGFTSLRHRWTWENMSGPLDTHTYMSRSVQVAGRGGSEERLVGIGQNGQAVPRVGSKIQEEKGRLIHTGKHLARFQKAEGKEKVFGENADFPAPGRPSDWQPSQTQQVPEESLGVFRAVRRKGPSVWEFIPTRTESKGKLFQVKIEKICDWQSSLIHSELSFRKKIVSALQGAEYGTQQCAEKQTPCHRVSSIRTVQLRLS